MNALRNAVSLILASAMTMLAGARGWSGAAPTRLDFARPATLQTSPTLGQTGDNLTMRIGGVTRAGAPDLAWPVKYAVATVTGNRVATLSGRTNAPSILPTRSFAPGGYLVAAEIDLPGSGVIRLARHIYLGDFERAADRFAREAALGLDRRSREGMTLAYCVRRVEALRKEAPEALRRASDEVIAYFGWSEEIHAARQTDDAFRDRRGPHVRAYWSPIDETPQYYSIYVPAGYDRGRAMPLVVSLHGYDPANMEYAARNRTVGAKMRQLSGRFGCMILEPFGRGNAFYRGLGEQDVLRAIAEVCRDYDVDRDRVFLMGYSMGGSGTWNMGTAFADRFAALGPVYGRTDYLLALAPPARLSLSAKENFLLERMSPLYAAENLLNTPVFINHGDKDDLVDVENSREMARQLERLGYDVRYWEHPELGHGGLPCEPALFQWFGRYRRPTAPARVRLKTASLGHGRMNWVSIERFERMFEWAEVDARISLGNALTLDTSNVTVLTLSPPAELVNAEKPLDVVWNGRPAEVERIAERQWRLISSTTPKQALTAAFHKTARFEGPMDDVWTSAFLIVQGTNAPTPQMRAVVEAETRNVAERWTTWQHAVPRIKNDTEVTTADMQSYHLILVGGPEENFITRQLLPEMPLSVKGETLEFFGETFAGGDLGLAMIYPNPRYPNRYVKMLLATSPAGLFGLDARSDRQFDFCIADGRTVYDGNGRPSAATTNVNRTMRAAGFFDQEWQYRPQNVIAGDEAVRRAVRILGRAPFCVNAAGAPNSLFLSDLIPSRQSGGFRSMALDRSTFGQPLQSGRSRGLGGRTNAKGVACPVIHERTEVEYALAGQYKRFRAVVGLQRPEGTELTDIERKNTRVIFAVTGDGKALWQSPPVTWDNGPATADVDVGGIQTLTLSVRNAVTWHYRADSANWCDARVEK